MNTLKPSDLFEKGYDALKRKDYLTAERFFLNVLFEHSKSQNCYIQFIGSLDKLSLYLYSAGHFEKKERAEMFFEIFSKTDRNASSGYATALINGIFGEPDYSKAIKVIQNTYSHDMYYLLGYLLHYGLGLEKNDFKAATLLNSIALQFSNRESQAKELLSEINLKIELEDLALEEEINRLLEELYGKEFNKPSYGRSSNDDSVIEFFKSIEFNPELEIVLSSNSQNSNLKNDTNLNDDHKYQIKNLDHFYATAMFAPVFKNNPKYCVGKFQDLTPYIAYDDVMNNKYIIRGRPVSITSNFDNEKREIISSYTSMEELVMDGWRLD